MKINTMAFTIEDYNALEEALALGAVSVKYADKEVVYRSTQEIKDIMLVIKAQLEGRSSIVRRKFAISDKGVYPSYE
jgi:hypothetical protein